MSDQDDGQQGDDVGQVSLDMYSREQLLELLTLSKAAMDDLQIRVDEATNERDGLLNQHDLLQQDLQAAKKNVDNLLNDQARMEEELAGRIEVLDKLRTQVRELEKERRESTKRYREQADSFESERQSWYDQEQHYKLRITNLTAPTTTKTTKRTKRAQRQQATEATSVTDAQSNMGDDDDLQENDEEETNSGQSPSIVSPEAPASPSAPSSSNPSTPDRRQANDTTSTTPSNDAHTAVLEQQLESLTTAHDSLSSTFRALQTELTDLKRMYEQVQDENESYEMLLGQRTLNGQVQGTELFRRSFQWGDSGSPNVGAAGGMFGFSGGLEAVGEDDDEYLDSLNGEEDSDDGNNEIDREKSASPTKLAARRQSRRRSRAPPKAATGTGNGTGLDLAAELEAAGSDDDARVETEEELSKRQDLARRRASQQARRETKANAVSETNVQGKTSYSVKLHEWPLIIMLTRLGTELQNEVRLLREANKALTLYVSKIVDRVCSQEGFEKVLAVDYRQTPQEPPAPPAKNDIVEDEAESATTSAGATAPNESNTSVENVQPPVEDDGAPQIKFRPTSLWKSSGTPGSASASGRTTSLNDTSLSPSTPSSSTLGFINGSNSSSSSAPRKAWNSLFGLARSASATTTTTNGVASSPSTPSTSRLPSSSFTTTPLESSLNTSARKLDAQDEDEDDLRERERLRQQMAMHGIHEDESGNQWGNKTPVIPTGVDAQPVDAFAAAAFSGTRLGGQQQQQTPPAPPPPLKDDNASTSTTKDSPSTRGTPNLTRGTTGVIGLGIADEPAVSTDSNSQNETPADKWGKTFKRLSMGWHSPPPPPTN
ncbi:hypothetical protein OIO90_001156 [Microbotryomycetes sp. JL221]|nr:hypothetical protein OIO90_001156 [Microbotryomycetes sp. JL221]